MINLERRIDNDLYIERSVYYNGLMHICRLLIDNLGDLLEKENRKFGIMIKYLQQIDFSILFIVEPKDDISIYNRIIYLFKPIILLEFKKLTKKRVTKADSVITILYRLLEFIVTSDTDNEYEYSKYALKILNIVEKMYDNIKNNGKKTSLAYLINSINQYIDEGLVGVQEDEYIRLDQKDKNLRMKIEDDGIRIKENKGLIKEIDLAG